MPPEEKYPQDFQGLYSIIKRLRGQDGCPWDQKQSLDTIRKYLIEEANELAEALAGNDHNHTCEETGDLFFILLMIVRICEEERFFTLDDVFSKIVEKMIRRHPHVFAGAIPGNEKELKRQWEAIKSQEKNDP